MLEKAEMSGEGQRLCVITLFRLQWMPLLLECSQIIVPIAEDTEPMEIIWADQLFLMQRDLG